MRVLVTGIAGFAGSHLADYLVERGGIEVYGLGRSEEDNISHLKGKIALELADLREPGPVRAAVGTIRPDYIFHLAAQAFVPRSWADPWETFENNIRGELNLLEALVAEKLTPRVLVVGSGDEYGKVRPEELPITEEQPLRPYNPYAVSKVAQDLLGYQYYASHRLPIVRVRPFNHLGPRQSPSFVASAFAKQIAEAEIGQRPATISVGDLEARRDFTDVRDVVRGYWLALEKGVPGEVYNIGSGQAHSIQELLDTLLGMSTIKLQVQTDPAQSRPSEVPVVICDARKFRERTGWQPTIPIQQSLQAVLDYWRQEVRKKERLP